MKLDAVLFCSTLIDAPQSVTCSSQSPVHTDNHCQVTAIITNHNRHIASVLRNFITLLLINLLYLIDKSNHVTSKTKFWEKKIPNVYNSGSYVFALSRDIEYTVIYTYIYIDEYFPTRRRLIYWQNIKNKGFRGFFYFLLLLFFENEYSSFKEDYDAIDSKNSIWI